MEFQEAKEKFIQSWGVLGTHWGINKTMAQIHALLLISPEVLSTEDIMQELKISRGNVNMNVRALMDWGIVTKSFKTGERREYFFADKDIWDVARKITEERTKRELLPVIAILNEVKDIQGEDKEVKQFKKTVSDLASFTSSLNSIIKKFIKSDAHWFYKSLLKIVK